jgi:hypothetical protein
MGEASASPGNAHAKMASAEKTAAQPAFLHANHASKKTNALPATTEAIFHSFLATDAASNAKPAT